MERLNDIYLELLGWLEYGGKPSEAIWHPLYYTYPWGLRFELGDPSLDDKDAYIRSALDRGQRIWDEVFSAEDEVLVIFDATPEPKLKQELKGCRMQRVRTRCMPACPGDETEYEEQYFYRYLYSAPADGIPFRSILTRIVEGELVARARVYSSAVYFYNRTKKLLFHPYDDRGADLIGPDRERLRPYYQSLQELLLDWNREDMDRKWRSRTVWLRVLITTTEEDRIRVVREELDRKLRGAQVIRESCQPYRKIEGWSELNLTIDSARPLKEIQYRLAGKWEADTASPQIHAEIFLPDVGFLWVHE